MAKKSKEYEEIDGIKVSCAMPESQKKYIKDAPEDDPDNPVDEDEYTDLSRQKITITIRLDGDVLDAVKRKAGKRGYQTLINQILRNIFIEKDKHRDFVFDELEQNQERFEELLIPLIKKILKKMA